MAGTKNDLPEGTDTIISGAGTTSSTTPGRSGTSVQGGATSQQGNATGARTAVTGSASDTSTDLITSGDSGSSSSGSSFGGSSDSAGGSSSSGGGVRGMLSNASSKVREQAGTKTRSFVGQGLETGGTTLTNLSEIVRDTVGQIEEKLGPQYGEYARTASEALDRYARTVSTKDPDELVEDVRGFVRKSPGVALGAAAVVGFSLVRLIKAGLEENGGSSSQRSTSSTSESAASGSSTGGGTGSGSGSTAGSGI